MLSIYNLSILGDKTITNITSGNRLRQSEIDFLLEILRKYGIIINHSTIGGIRKYHQQQQNNPVNNQINDIDNDFYVNNNNNVRQNDDNYGDGDDAILRMLKRTFAPPIANAMQRSEMNPESFSSLRNKILYETKQSKARRSGKESEEKFVPSISVGELYGTLCLVVQK